MNKIGLFVFLFCVPVFSFGEGFFAEEDFWAGPVVVYSWCSKNQVVVQDRNHIVVTDDCDRRDHFGRKRSCVEQHSSANNFVIVQAECR